MFMIIFFVYPFWLSIQDKVKPRTTLSDATNFQNYLFKLRYPVARFVYKRLLQNITVERPNQINSLKVLKSNSFKKLSAILFKLYTDCINQWDPSDLNI